MFYAHETGVLLREKIYHINIRAKFYQNPEKRLMIIYYILSDYKKRNDIKNIVIVLKKNKN